MACILNIETSTEVCSVAVVDEGHVIWNEEERTESCRDTRSLC